MYYRMIYWFHNTPKYTIIHDNDEVYCSRLGALPLTKSEPRSEDYKTRFYSYLACFVNTLTLNVYGFLSYTGLTRRNTRFIFLWLRHRNRVHPDATGNGHTTGEDPTHGGPTQRGGPRRAPTTGGEGHTGDPLRTHTDTLPLTESEPRRAR